MKILPFTIEVNMRKMAQFALAFLGFFWVACSQLDDTYMSGNYKSWLCQPDSMIIDVKWQESEDSIQTVQLALGHGWGGNPKRYIQDYWHFSYVSKTQEGPYRSVLTEEKEADGSIKLYAHEPLDSNNHLQFTIVSWDSVERSFDVDFSELVHPYTREGSTAIFRIPEYVDSVLVQRISKESDGRFALQGERLLPKNISNDTVVVRMANRIFTNVSIFFTIMEQGFGHDRVSGYVEFYF